MARSKHTPGTNTHAPAGAIIAVVIACASALALAGCAGPRERPAPAEPLYFPSPPDEARFQFERTVQSSADLQGVAAGTRFRALVTGESASGVAMAKPFDVVACQGRVFVSDTVRRRVMVFDVPGQRFFEIGEDGPGELRKPLGLAVDEECNLFVADGTTSRVMLYDQSGQHIRAFGGDNVFARLSHVAVNAEGSLLFAVDTGSVQTNEHRVRVFDVDTGEHLRDIGTRGDGPGELNLPRDAEVSADGRLYLIDGGNFRVQVFEADGTFVRSFGALGRRYGQFARPKGIALDADGNVYVSDSAHGNFQIFDAQGQLLLFVGQRSERFGRANYMLPAGIDVDEDGRVYLIDQFFRKLDVFRPAGLAPDQGFLGSWKLP